MERLTKRNKYGDFYYPHCFREDTCGGMGAGEKCEKCEFTGRICNKIGEYEELEEQGLLIKLPCKLGDALYTIEVWDDTNEYKIYEYSFDGIETGGLRLMYHHNPEDICTVAYEELGNKVFVTREAAEQALEKVKMEIKHKENIHNDQQNDKQQSHPVR